jgi:hypothetical protein
MKITVDELKKIINEIDELLKHAKGQSEIQKMCQKYVNCTDCPLCVWDYEWEGYCCVISDIGLSEMNTDMLDRLRQGLVNTLEKIEVG